MKNKNNQQLDFPILPNEPEINEKKQKPQMHISEEQYEEESFVYDHDVSAYEYANKNHAHWNEELEEDVKDFTEEESFFQTKENYFQKFMRITRKLFYNVDSNTTVNLREIELPTGVQKRVTTQYLMSLAVVFFCIFLSLFYKNPSYLLGMIIAAALVYLGISTTLDYSDGRIAELPVICASINQIPLRNKTTVVFRTDEEYPQYFEFNLPGKRKNEFQQNAIYVIYFNPDKPNELLGYVLA